jgi:hypothetical protein
MNDFEQRLARHPFREPPAELRAQILQASARATTELPPATGWRDWFWPSPWAWGALAALWVIFAGVQLVDQYMADGPRFADLAAAAPDAKTSEPKSVIVAFYNSRELYHALDLSN